MVLRKVLPIITIFGVFSSSPLLAQNAGSLPLAPASALEITATTLQPNRPEPSCELKVKERYEYYNVDGKTVPELERQMKHHGTKWDDGNTYAAVTSWDINYRYDITEDNGRCSVKSVKTNVDIVYQLPRMVPGAAPNLAPAWDKYMEHLRFHEFGHKDIAVKIAGEINEVLSTMGPFNSAEELEKEAKRLTDEKLKELNEQQVGYDADTMHGETQGAILAAN